MPVVYAGDERRTQPRIPFAVTAQVHAAGRELPCTTVDLSATGLLLVPPASARPGLQMRVDFDLPARIGQLRLSAVLMREGQSRGSYAWGVQFQNVPRMAREMLRGYVADQLAMSSSSPHLPSVERRPADAQPIRHAPTDSGIYFQLNRRTNDGASGAGRSVSSEDAARSFSRRSSTLLDTPQHASNLPSVPNVRVRQRAEPMAGRSQPLDEATGTGPHQQVGHRSHPRAAPQPPPTGTGPHQRVGSSSFRRLGVQPPDSGTGPYQRVGTTRRRSAAGLEATQPMRSGRLGEDSASGSGMGSGSYRKVRAGTPAAGTAAAGTAADTAPKLDGMTAPRDVRARRRGAVRVGSSTAAASSGRASSSRASSSQSTASASITRKGVGERRPSPTAEKEWGRRSHATPSEIRELYQAALDEVEGKGKRKSWYK